jgi:cystathionine beta-lyase
MYNFDAQNRYGTDCLKFDFALERGYQADCLSYWVADMDFKTAPEILEALNQRVNHGVFGYTNTKPHYFEAVKNWMKSHHNYEIKQDWLVETPGVVFAIATAIRGLTKKNDSILLLSPVYYPFSNIIKSTGRKIVSSSLQWKENLQGIGHWEIDFEDLEAKIKKHNVKLFLLCNPHNPGGRVWNKTKLERIAEICLKHNVLVFSDEIHCDFVWAPNVHTVFASLSTEIEQITITATSPSKSFNLAGLQVSNIFIANKNLRQKFKIEKAKTGYDEPNTLGLVAAETALRNGNPWLLECKKVIYENLVFASNYLNNSGIGLKASVPEGTYLLWVDCSNLPFDDTEQNRRIVKEGNLWLDSGHIFGPEGLNFQRINVATSHQYLEQGLKAFVRCLSNK